MEKKTNAGYTLTDTISVAGSTYVLGHNPNNSLVPYVTWEASEDLDYFVHGHYISNRDDALLDLMKRATDRLEVNGQSIVPQLLSDQDRSNLRSEFDHENALCDIEACLSDAISALDADPSCVQELMDNPDFQSRAVHAYYKIDHSYENEALTDLLREIVNEHFPEKLPQEFSATLKISPEEMDILNDVLSLTADEVKKKYGPFEAGDGPLQFWQSVQSRYGVASFGISIAPRENPETENAVRIMLYHPEFENRTAQRICEETELKGVSQLEQIYSMEDNKGRTWSVDLHADERLRRIGQMYVFSTDAEDLQYAEKQGEICTIERMLTKEENDTLYSGLMWKARFDDGTVLDVFDNELKLPREKQLDLDLRPAQVKPVSPKLEEKLMSAQERAEQSHFQTKQQGLQR